MQTLPQDLRYSLRQLIKSPGFTLIALVALVLGIGATTAAFSVIYAALIDPYLYPNADRTAHTWEQSEFCWPGRHCWEWCLESRVRFPRGTRRGWTR